jgi:predicted 2-oxoglutarate/Fe(II)-dependent dioxygenase YbiX
MNYRKLSPKVFLYENIMTLEESSSLIKDFENVAEWKDSYVGDDQKVESIRSSIQAKVEHKKSRLSNKIVTQLLEKTNHYKVLNKIDLLYQLEGVSLIKYEQGNYFKEHADIAEGGIPRAVSCVIYLNPSEYDGGELEFTRLGLSVKTESPSMILFPSGEEYSHIAHPVKSGTKYSVVTWFADKR